MTGRAIRAGQGYIEIGLRNRLARGARSIQSDLNNIGSRAKSMGTAVATAGLAMATPFALAAGKFATFDDAMRSVKAISQATNSDFAMLRETALELGRTTSFTAVQVAELMTELSRAGFDPSQVNAMTQAVLDLSRATGTDSAMSAGIMAASIRQFGLEAEDATRVADSLTAAANKSFNTVESLGQAMEYAGPVAADMGMSFEETLAILGTLGNVGIQGSMAGTAIRRLATIGAAEAEKLERIFGVAFVDSAGNARPLVDALGDVAEATNDLPTAERARKFNEAFGLLGITGASAISKSATSTRELMAEIESASGVARKTAEEMDAGLGGSFRKILSATEGLQIALGDAFAPALKTVTDLVTQSLGPITKWISENKTLVTVVATAAGALVAGGAALIAFGTVATLAASAIGTLFSAFSLIATIASPLYLAVGAMAALGFAILEYTTLGVDALDWLKMRFGPLVETVGNAVRAIVALIGEGNVNEAWEMVTDLMELVWKDLSGSIQNVWGDVMDYVLDAGSATAAGIGRVFQSLASALQGMLDAYRSYYDSAFNTMTKQFGEMTGVRTIGGSGGGRSAFDDQFGSQISAIENSIGQVKDFGVAMEEEANAQVGQRMKERERAKADRAKARAELRANINAAANEAIQGIEAEGGDAELEQKKLDMEAKKKQKALGDRIGDAMDGARRSAGPTATFDATAAAIIGMGPRFENEALKAQKETAKNTGVIAKEAKNEKLARFG